jgi:hypothetical protein
MIFKIMTLLFFKIITIWNHKIIILYKSEFFSWHFYILCSNIYWTQHIEFCFLWLEGGF